MQDILDSNYQFLSLNNMPNSRTASMQKINKRQNKHSPDNNLTPSHSTYNDLFGSVLYKDNKAFNSNESSSINTTKRHQDKYDLNLDSFPSSPKPEQKYQTHQNNHYQRLSIHNSSQGDILGEDHGINQHFGNTQKSIINPSRGTDSLVSSRQMKPPIRPKQNNYSGSLNFGGSLAGIIVEEDPTLTNSSHKNSNNRSLNRRSSIDGKSQMSDDVLPLSRPNGGSLNNFQYDTIKEDFLSNIHKSESYVVPQYRSSENDSNNFFKAKDKLQSKSSSLKVGIAQEDEKKVCNCEERINQKQKQIISDYERQVDLLKATYQKQVAYLQECLQKQIEENRNLRGKFLQESNRMIEEERNRTSRMHQDEVDRLKEIFAWQQKKQQGTYQLQVNSLKASLGVAAEQRDWFSTNNRPSSNNLQFLQNQLQSKQFRIDTKLKSIQQRQLQLQTRESDLSIRLKRQEDKVRHQEKRLMQMQTDFKKRMLEQKKALSQQKQQVVFESGKYQSQLMKMRQQLSLKERQMELQRSALEQDKQTLQMLNSQAMSKHKQNLSEMQMERQRLKDMQIDMVKKMRVIDMRGKQLSIQCNNHEDLPPKQLNNFLENSFNKNGQSRQKRLQTSNSASTLNRTKERFYNLQRNVKSRLNLSSKENKIDLSGYMTRMDNTRYNRL